MHSQMQCHEYGILGTIIISSHKHKVKSAFRTIIKDKTHILRGRKDAKVLYYILPNYYLMILENLSVDFLLLLILITGHNDLRKSTLNKF